MLQQNVGGTFSTMDRQAIHPQKGIPQLYHDQMNVIAQHLFDIKYNPFELPEMKDGYKLIQIANNNTSNTTTNKKKHGSIKAVKKRARLTHGKITQGRGRTMDRLGEQ